MENEINNDVLARLMYAAYYKEANGKAFNGAAIPLWQELGIDRQRCWIAAARAAKGAL
jgi:hypothetical protein